MIVIADTSPLNYLIRLGHSEVLRQMYGRVLVPHAVLIEMQHPEAPVEIHDWASRPPPWLEVVNVQQLDDSLAAELGPGERHAISLALEVHADVLLIDELAGRKEAEARNRSSRYAGSSAASIASRLCRFSTSDETTPRMWVPCFAACRSGDAGPV